MKQYRATILMGVIFVGLLVWALATQRGRVPAKEEIFRLQYDQVTKLQVVQGKAEEGSNKKPGAVVTLEKRGKDWYLTQPVEGLADPTRVRQMVEEFAKLQASPRPDADPQKKEYGLQEPVLTVTGWWDEGRQHAVIKLGAEAPIGAKRYATIEGRKGIFLVPSYFKVAMDKSVDDLRDRKLTRIERADVDEITIAFDDKTVTVRRQAKPAAEDQEASWRLVSPIEAEADEQAVGSVIRAIVNAEAVDFAPLPKSAADYGLDKPQVTVTLHTPQGGDETFVFGKQQERAVKKRWGEGTETKSVVYAQKQGRNEVLLLEPYIITDVRKSELALRDKHIVKISQDQVTGLRVQAQERYSFQATKAGGEWKLTTAGSGVRLNTSKINTILWDIEDMEAVRYVEEHPTDLGKYGLELPRVVIELTVRGRRSPLKLYFGNEIKDNATVYVRTSESDQVYTVNDTIITDLPTSLEELKEIDHGVQSGVPGNE